MCALTVVCKKQKDMKFSPIFDCAAMFTSKYNFATEVPPTIYITVNTLTYWISKTTVIPTK